MLQTTDRPFHIIKAVERTMAKLSAWVRTCGDDMAGRQTSSKYRSSRSSSSASAGGERGGQVGVVERRVSS